MVTVQVTGDLTVKSITIDRQAVDPDDVELLQNMVLAAVNEALRSAPELTSSGWAASPVAWEASASPGCENSHRRVTDGRK